MNGAKWTAEEKKLLKTNMTTEQIAEATGRTKEAVRRARYRAFCRGRQGPDNIRREVIRGGA